uniref:Alternative protein n=1 Tax=Mesocestoides corti TaxID=53468 RepID=A0A5K3F935_MESCO
VEDLVSRKNPLLDDAVASKDPSKIAAAIQSISATMKQSILSDSEQDSPELRDHKRNTRAKLLELLVASLDYVPPEDSTYLLQTASILDAIASNSAEMPYPTTK